MSAKKSHPQTAKPITSPELDYLEANFDQLSKQYPGEPVAIKGNALVGHAKTIHELRKQVQEQGFKRPFVTRVGPDTWGDPHLRIYNPSWFEPLYDPDADAATIYLSPCREPGCIVRTEALEQNPWILLDFDGEDRLVSIEVLHASKFLHPEMLNKAKRA